MLPGALFGVVVALSTKPGAPALCIPEGGQLLGASRWGPRAHAGEGRTSQHGGLLTPLAWEDGTAGMARQGWQGGRMAGQEGSRAQVTGREDGRAGMAGLSAGGAVQAACTQQLSALLPSSARPQPLPRGTDGFNTFLGLFFSIINSCLQVGRHFFPFGRAIKLSLVVRFFKASVYLFPNHSLLFLPGSFMALGCPPLFFPLALARR